MGAPLEGIKVLDLSRLLPGPFCTQLLADLGARVVKVEDTQGGDYARAGAPAIDGQSAFYAAINRNKQSIKLNLKKPEGVAAFKKLLPNFDVVVDTFRPGVVEKLGVGYETCRAIHPKVVYCAITGYGQDGPYAQRAGHDNNYLALAGVGGITGEPGRRPVLCGFQLADLGGGALFGLSSILAGLLQAQRTGTGTYCDVSMHDGAFAFLAPHMAGYLQQKDNVPGPSTMLLSGAVVCYNIYQTKDGRYMSVGSLEPKFWQAFCQVTKRPDIQPFAFTKAADGEKGYETVRELFRSKTQAEWAELLKDADCCVEPIWDFAQTENDPQLAARKMWISIRNRKGESVKLPSHPFRFSTVEKKSEDAPPPQYGEHTQAVLKEFGFTDADVAQLKTGGVI
ncbi:MAG: CoA transferase [Deltaproteobacteria bacterium]|nr:CoA transferase [Deltaproteobacteria bacterium]